MTVTNVNRPCTEHKLLLFEWNYATCSRSCVIPSYRAFSGSTSYTNHVLCFFYTNFGVIFIGNRDQILRWRRLFLELKFLSFFKIKIKVSNIIIENLTSRLRRFQTQASYTHFSHRGRVPTVSECLKLQQRYQILSLRIQRALGLTIRSGCMVLIRPIWHCSSLDWVLCVLLFLD